MQTEVRKTAMRNADLMLISSILGFVALSTLLGPASAVLQTPTVELVRQWETEKNVACPQSHFFSRFSFPRRPHFPEDFVFGASSTAYQYEGSEKGGGRGLTIWDDFNHRHPGKLLNGSSADVAVDFMNHYEEDIQRMKQMNMDAFVFSISWSRILPYGRRNKGFNKKGIKFYNTLINQLIDNDIEPMVVLFHWDTPLALEEEYRGFLNRRIVEDFREYARLCFELYGDRVKVWATINDPWTYAIGGYEYGTKAPGRCSKWINPECDGGNSTVEPYVVAHNLLLAHLAAAEEFKECKKCKELGGRIGIVLGSAWLLPPDRENINFTRAVNRSLDFTLGWFLNPLINGKYPATMRGKVKKRLPKFTLEESKGLKNSSHFIGINYHGAFYATPMEGVDPRKVSYTTDAAVHWTTDRSGGCLRGGTDANTQGSSYHKILIYPRGLRLILSYIKEYTNKTIVVAENGIAQEGNGEPNATLADEMRKKYIQDHLYNLEQAICKDKVDVRAYFVWSLLDTFEWEHGYSSRYGLYHVDFENGMKRTPKTSAEWLTEFLDKKPVTETGRPGSHSFIDFLDALGVDAW